MVRDRILEIFLELREDRNAPYDETDLVEYLRRPSAAADGRRRSDTIKGTWLASKFHERIELEFEVCFPQAFYDKRWGLDDLSAYVENRIRKPKINLRMVRKNQREARISAFNPFLFANCLFAVLILATPWPYRLVSIAICVSLNALMIWLWLHDYRHDKKLEALIEKKLAG